MTVPFHFEAPKADDHVRLLWLTGKFKSELYAALKALEAGMQASVAFDTALQMLDVHYKQACRLEGIQPINQQLDPTGIELQARFALDALFGSLKGSPDEAEARKAFWQVMRRATLPSLTR